jgi:hypothetical protein
VIEELECPDCKHQRDLSVDSSYGSGEDEKHHKSLAKAVRVFCRSRTGFSNGDDSESDADESDSGEEALINGRSASGKKLCQPLEAMDVAMSRLLLSAMQRGTRVVAPVDIASVRQKIISGKDVSIGPKCSACQNHACEPSPKPKDIEIPTLVTRPKIEAGRSQVQMRSATSRQRSCSV